MNRSAATLFLDRTATPANTAKTHLSSAGVAAGWLPGLTSAPGRLLLLALMVLGFLGSATTHLRAVGDDAGNPTGVSGSYNGEVGTAGSYDPFTRNAKRAVTDLTVPGSCGSYPLAFTRIFNSRPNAIDSDYACFGDGVSWRHSYQWALASDTDPDGNTCYLIAYPDGRVVNYCRNRTYKPTVENYLRGPVGTQDRFEYQDDLHMYLHLQDGGIVTFKKVGQNDPPAITIYGRATSITDPYGAVTLLKYDLNPLLLSQVVEPGGRTLAFKMHMENGRSVLESVTDSNGRVVTYGYGTKGEHSGPGVAGSLQPHPRQPGGPGQRRAERRRAGLLQLLRLR